MVADKALSTNAHNVKIITTNGVVTLRGPVKSPEEKDTIAAKASSGRGEERRQPTRDREPLSSP